MDTSISVSVKMGNGEVVEYANKGTSAISTKKCIKFICHILYMPKLDQNLLIVPQMMNNGYTFIFGNN